jgi:hypothetical protein
LEHVDQVLTLAFLIKRGTRISELAGLDKAQMAERQMAYTSDDDRKERMISRLIVFMFREDMDLFELELNACVKLFGIHDIILSVVLPLLKRCNILSYKNSSSDVHFAVTAIRRKIILAIESIEEPPPRTTIALLFLFKGEHYDLMLLCINYMLRTSGVRILYLGTDISLDTLEKVIMEKKPDMLFSYVTSFSFIERIYSTTVAKHLPNASLYLYHASENTAVHSDYSNIIYRPLSALSELPESFVKA